MGSRKEFSEDPKLVGPGNVGGEALVEDRRVAFAMEAKINTNITRGCGRGDGDMVAGKLVTQQIGSGDVGGKDSRLLGKNEPNVIETFMES